MKVTIKRDTGFIDMVTPLELKFNGLTIERLEYNEEKKINIDEDGGQLSVKQRCGQSDKINISDGDTVTIQYYLSHLLLFPIGLVLLLLGNTLIEWIIEDISIWDHLFYLVPAVIVLAISAIYPYKIKLIKS